MRLLALPLAVLLAGAAPAALVIDLNVNAPIDPGTGNIAGQIQPGGIAQTGVDSVRVNCILGPWSSPADTALHGSPGRTWFQTYDAIVDGFVAQGIDVYMLIGAEAVAGSSRAAFATEGWTQAYAANFAAIAEHFRDRVFVYEGFNEPNDWAGGASAQVEPRWFAYQTQRIYEAVKIGPGGSHLGDPSYQNLTIVTGPLFTHEIGGPPGDSGGPYWTAAANAGIGGDAAIPGLDWGGVMAATGSYPYDGIGLHIYVRGETDSVPQITGSFQAKIDAMWSAMTAVEPLGAATPKRIWISEFGWNRDSLATGLGAANAADAQGRNLSTAYQILRADGRVALGSWFSLVDFGGVGNTWGLYSGALAPASRNPAWWFLRWESLIGAGTPNAALNAGFEAATLAEWTGFGDTDGVVTGPWFAGITPRTGARFHGTAANFGARDGGGVRQTFAATPGSPVAAGVWVRTYREGGSGGDTACRVGLDRSGGTDPQAAGVVWSEWTESPDFWRPVCVASTATGGSFTVFLQHRQAAPVWNVTCFDDAVVLGGTAVPADLTALFVR